MKIYRETFSTPDSRFPALGGAYAFSFEYIGKKLRNAIEGYEGYKCVTQYDYDHIVSFEDTGASDEAMRALIDFWIDEFRMYSKPMGDYYDVEEIEPRKYAVSISETREHLYMPRDASDALRRGEGV